MRTHKAISDRLKKQIAGRCRVGERLPPIRVLARQFKVSPTTVCQSLAVLAHEGWVEQRQGSGVYVRDRKEQRHVGVVMKVDFSTPHASYFWRRLAQQARIKLLQEGYPVRLYTGVELPGEAETVLGEDFREDLAADRLMGVLEANGDGDPTWVKPLQQRGVPIVGHLSDGYEYGVLLDSADWIQQAVLRLLAAGRRRIAMMCWQWSAENVIVDFRKVFCDTLAAYGVPVHSEWIRLDVYPGIMGAGWSMFREIWSAKPEKPDGLVIGDDLLLQSATTAILQQRVRVPEHLLIMGQMSKGSDLHLPIPAVCAECDPDEYAGAMVDLLVKQLRGEPVVAPKVMLRYRWPDVMSTDTEAWETQQLTRKEIIHVHDSNTASRTT
ncbi:MAG: LacI family DNA-binding transcriptional regulator [Phycisphaeraceae bacterium]|nr:LacI family DNA-binding transcriptional regulator [Phycisphaeraceae bacterium]